MSGGAGAGEGVQNYCGFIVGYGNYFLYKLDWLWIVKYV
jgi:hypothetical protein